MGPLLRFNFLYDDIYKFFGIFEKLPVIAKKLRDTVNATGLNILQSNEKDAGQVIEHIHFHLIPRYPEDNLMHLVPKAQLSDDEAKPILENFQK